MTILPLSLAIGQFDGVHLGHQHIFRETVEAARRRGSTAACLTFHPHVAHILNPQQAPLLLATPEQNADYIRRCGIQDIRVMPFTAALASTRAPDFLALLKETFPTLQDIVVGENFTFGLNREGNRDTLPVLAEELNLTAHIVPHMEWQGETISSTRIRTAIAEGDMAAAQAMLGRPFSMTGTIGHGRAIGRLMGIPTANIFPDLPIHPAPGVYAARVDIDGALYAAGAFVPDSFDARQLHFQSAIEAHLLDFDGDLYAMPAEIFFVRRLRGFQSFPSLEETARHIRADLDTIRHELL